MSVSRIQISPENDSFVTSFMHLKLRREDKRDSMGVGESKVELDWRIADKIMCSLEGGYHLFQKCVNIDAQKQWTVLA